ncbi:Opioid growth factor receptor [Teratosphaeria destructans]|uniref:Opioid growth factor receptor n=1 Tax=Teratosphaeria destructans TaxID=418781 RepID=A0A9W7SSA9_9PEZI|nr:Opioid growth factor receptor [Teratosphaeria destructans]
MLLFDAKDSSGHMLELSVGKCSPFTYQPHAYLRHPSTSAFSFLLTTATSGTCTYSPEPPHRPPSINYRLHHSVIHIAMSPHPILAFFDSNINAPFDPHDPRTTLNHVLLWDDATLEYRHDYIQHLFPLPEPSAFHSHAPIVTQEVRDAFMADHGLRSRLLQACDRMYRFYCLDHIPATPTDAPNKDECSPATRDTNWTDMRSPFVQRIRAKIAKRHDHNHLRLTRIVRCLRVLDCEEKAKDLYDSLIRIDDVFDNPIAPVTRAFWTAAMEWPLYRVPNLHKDQTVEWLREASVEDPVEV